MNKWWIQHKDSYPLTQTAEMFYTLTSVSSFNSSLSSLHADISPSLFHPLLTINLPPLLLSFSRHACYRVQNKITSRHQFLNLHGERREWRGWDGEDGNGTTELKWERRWEKGEARWWKHGKEESDETQLKKLVEGHSAAWNNFLSRFWKRKKIKENVKTVLRVVLWLLVSERFKNKVLMRGAHYALHWYKTGRTGDLMNSHSSLLVACFNSQASKHTHTSPHGRGRYLLQLHLQESQLKFFLEPLLTVDRASQHFCFIPVKWIIYLFLFVVSIMTYRGVTWI